MNTCLESFQGYALRALGRDFGERLLPRGTDITVCDQVVLIGSGLLWNIYFAVLAVSLAYTLAVAAAVGKASSRRWLNWPSRFFIFLFRGSPLFIQFFFFYSAFVLLPRGGIEIPLGFITMTADTSALTRAGVGGLIVLTLNTAAYSAELFYGALKALPQGDLDAADAFGMTGFRRFRRIVWPTMMRLAWPSYTNEVIFLTHATALVFLSAFPARQQSGEALYYARYFVEQTFNPFVAFPIVAAYFVLLTLAIIGIMSIGNRRLNRHLPGEKRAKLRVRPQYLR